MDSVSELMLHSKHTLWKEKVVLLETDELCPANNSRAVCGVSEDARSEGRGL